MRVCVLLGLALPLPAGGATAARRVTALLPLVRACLSERAALSVQRCALRSASTCTFVAAGAVLSRVNLCYG